MPVVTASYRRWIRERAEKRGPIRRFLVRNPGVETALWRGAAVAGAGATLGLLGLRNARLAKRAMHEARASRTLWRGFRRTRVWSKAREAERHRIGQVAHALGVTETKLDKRARAFQAYAVGRRRNSTRLAKAFAIGALPAGAWIGMPLGYARARYEERQQSKHAPPLVVITKARKREGRR